jgi:hypothetical protein
MANCDACTKLRNWFIRALRGNQVRLTMKVGPPVITNIISRRAGVLTTDAGDIDIKDIDDVNRASGPNPRRGT